MCIWPLWERTMARQSRPAKASSHWLFIVDLTHWGRVMHICVSKLSTIASDNGLTPGRRQAIIWTNARILLIGPLGTNFIEILIGIQTFSFKKMHLKMSSAKWRPFCLGLNVLISETQQLRKWQMLLRRRLTKSLLNWGNAYGSLK